MCTVVIGIGIPGSGKTTFLKKLATETEAAYVCADDIRKEITGSAINHDHESEVWEIFYQRIDAALDNGEDIYIDVTNAVGTNRRKLATHCKSKSRMVIGIWFDMPVDVCKQRNSSRSRVVPDYAIDRMLKQLEVDPPTKQDGFDILHHIYS